MIVKLFIFSENSWTKGSSDYRKRLPHFTMNILSYILLLGVLMTGMMLALGIEVLVPFYLFQGHALLSLEVPRPFIV